jgi:hypothetical protein
MIRIPRWLISSTGALFATFQALLGFTALDDYKSPAQGAVAIFIYLFAVAATAVLYRGLKMPLSQALINLAVSIFVPYLTNLNLEPSQNSAYSTWYVIGIAVLMAGTAIREHAIIAWLGTGILVLQVFAWAGFLVGWQTGLAGAVMLVFAGVAISRGISRASSEVTFYGLQARDTERDLEVSKAIAEERRLRLDFALSGALPMLKTIQQSSGDLSEADRAEARLLEAALRDEIRGRSLMNDEIRIASREARKRGLEVIILDEGGMDQIDETQKSKILKTIAQQMNEMEQGRVILRAPKDEAWSVTLVATRPGIAKPDVWLKF